MTKRALATGLIAAPPVAWLAAAHPTAARTVALVAGLALITWATAQLAARRVSRHAPPPTPRGRDFTVRPQRRLERRPTGRGPRDVRCPAGHAPQRHSARRPADR